MEVSLVRRPVDDGETHSRFLSVPGSGRVPTWVVVELAGVMGDNVQHPEALSDIVVELKNAGGVLLAPGSRSPHGDPSSRTPSAHPDA